MFNEREVLHRISQRDPTAFSLLVIQYQKLVFHVVQRVISRAEDVEDISQEVFIKVYERLHTFAFESKLSTWIARVAYLTAIDHRRKYPSNASAIQPVDQLSITDQTPERILIQADITLIIQQLVASLPESYRVVLTLYHLEEFSLGEIEQITGMPIGTVKNYLFRARKLLKDKVAVYFDEDLL